MCSHVRVCKLKKKSSSKATGFSSKSPRIALHSGRSRDAPTRLPLPKQLAGRRWDLGSSRCSVLLAFTNIADLAYLLRNTALPKQNPWVSWQAF